MLKKTTGNHSQKSVLLFFTIAAVTALAVYGRALDAPTYLDDRSVITDARQFEIRFSPSFLVWRPLAYFSYAVSAGMADLFSMVLPFGETFYFRFANVLVHALAATGVFLLGRELSGRSFVGTAAGLIFLVHPLPSQAVTYIAQRFESLAAMFMFWTAFAYVRYRRTKELGWLGLVIGLSIAALTSKSTALALPLWLLLIEFLFVHERKPLTARAVAWVIPAGLILLLFAWGGLGAYGGLTAIPWQSHLISQGPVLSHYLGLAVYPSELFLTYEFDPVSEITLAVLAQWAFVVALLGAGLYLLRVNRLAGFGLLTFFVLLLPTIVVPRPDLIFDYRAYGAFAGLAIAAAALAPRTWITGRFVVLASVVLILAVRTFALNGAWHDSVAFFERHRAQFPESSRILMSLSASQIDAGDLQRAKETALQAREYEHLLNSYYHPKTAAGNAINLGMLYLAEGNYESAQAEASRALALYPEQVSALMILGHAQLASGDPGSARRTFEQAAKEAPSNVAVWNALSQSFERLGLQQEAAAARSRGAEENNKLVATSADGSAIGEQHRGTIMFGLTFGALVVVLLVGRLFLTSRAELRSLLAD